MKETKELPLYRKIRNESVYVRALIIHSVCRNRRGALLTPVDEEYPSFQVDCDYCLLHRPRAGGYFLTDGETRSGFWKRLVFEKTFVGVAEPSAESVWGRSDRHFL